MLVIKMTWIAIMIVCGMLGGSWRVGALETSNEAISVHGFISQGYLVSDSNDVYGETRHGSFQFNEFGLAFLAQLSDRLHVGIQMLSRDLGDSGNNAVELDWAFADYRWKDWLGFRGGVLKMPWGVYNETRDIDMLRTSIFLPSSLYDEKNRDVYATLQGIAFYGSFPLRKFGTLNYQFQYGDKSLPEAHAEIEADGAVTIDSFNVHNIYLGTLEWETPLEGLRLRETTGKYMWKMRGAWILGPEDGEHAEAFTDTGHDTVSILSADYVLERLSLATEWFQVWDTTDGDLIEEGADEGGWYVGAGYRLTDWMEIGAYYSEFYEESDDREGKEYIEHGLPGYLGWQKDLALTTRFDFGDHCTVKLEGHFMDGAAQFASQSSGLPEQETLLLAVKATFGF